jgi:hypothetical protein
LEEPTCILLAEQTMIIPGSTVRFSGQTQEWSTFVHLDDTENNIFYDFATQYPGGLPVSYFYYGSGVSRVVNSSFTAGALVRNNW